MRLFVTALVGAMALVGAAFAQAPSALLAPEAEACLRDYAPRVERAIEDLSQATAFLVNQVCAEEVVAAQRDRQRESRHRVAARMRARCETDAANPPNWCSIVDTDADADTELAVGWQTPPHSTTAFAARLLLELREQRTVR